MLNLSEIQVFAIAAETENFSETARRIQLSQPAVSQQIHSLENYLGTELFVRSGRGVALTDAGKVMLPMARELLGLSRRIEETIKSLDEQVAGHLIISCTTTAGKYVLPLIAATFRQRHPNVHVTIKMCTSASIIDPLLAQQVHLGVTNEEVVHQDMECQLFFTDHVVLVVPPDHPFAHRSSIRADKLLNQPFILQEEGDSTHHLVQQGLAKHDISLDQLQVMMVMGNAEAIGTAVELGLGIAFISRLAARHGFELKRLVEVPVQNLHMERPLYMVRGSHFAKTLAQTRFWDFVKEHREEISQRLAHTSLYQK